MPACHLMSTFGSQFESQRQICGVVSAFSIQRAGNTDNPVCRGRIGDRSMAAPGERTRRARADRANMAAPIGLLSPLATSYGSKNGACISSPASSHSPAELQPAGSEDLAKPARSAGWHRLPPPSADTTLVQLLAGLSRDGKRVDCGSVLRSFAKPRKASSGVRAVGGASSFSTSLRASSLGLMLSATALRAKAAKASGDKRMVRGRASMSEILRHVARVCKRRASTPTGGL